MHDIGYLRDILILLFASVAIVLIFKQFRLSPALGYLVAGAAIGPFGFGVLSTTETTKSLAELGIVFLLFAIGLELTIEKLTEMRKSVLGLGALQIIITAGAGYLASHYCFHLSIETSVIIGSALSLSSTAIVLQVITENHEGSTRVGRTSFAILLLQDLAVIPILVLLPMLSNHESKIASSLVEAVSNAVIAMGIIFVCGKIFLSPIYKLAVGTNKGHKNDVLFLSVTLIVVLGSSYLSQMMGLSSALGAFIAGLMVAETKYKHRVEDDVIALKSLFMGLFFMTIGMSFDFDILVKSLPAIIMVSLLLISIKAAIIIGLAKFFKFSVAVAIHLGLLLAQGSEFAFVVFVMAVEKSFLTPELSQFLATVVTVSMAVTPLLASVGRKVKAKLYTIEVLLNQDTRRVIDTYSGHIVIIGFTKIGRIISHILREKKIEYVVLEGANKLVKSAKQAGYNIVYGDPTNIDILHYIGIERAESVIIAFKDELISIKIARFIRENFPNMNIIISSDLNNADRFKKVGVNSIVLNNVQLALELARVGMLSTGCSNPEVEGAIRNFRSLNHEAIKSIFEDKFENEEREEVADKKN